MYRLLDIIEIGQQGTDLQVPDLQQVAGITVLEWR
jgi:hypothetical protein